MQNTRVTQRRLRAGDRYAFAGVAVFCLLTAGCGEPQPRTFADFMEDRMAMDGTLARCNEDREGTLNDLECANARRAASAIALVIERERREVLERESERKLAELRAELERRERAEREALAVAEAARQAAYEAQWHDADAIPTDVLSGGTAIDSAGAPEIVSAAAPEVVAAGAAPSNAAAQPVLEPAPPPASEPALQLPRPFREPEANADVR